MALTFFVPKLVSVTVALGTIAPVVPVTVPVMSPVVLCADRQGITVKARHPLNKIAYTVDWVRRDVARVNNCFLMLCVISFLMRYNRARE